jgi:trimeric autotransporter adhesin
MIRPQHLKVFYPLLLALLLTIAPHLTSAQENTPEAITLATTFTYQGYLEQGGVPLTATCDMQFSLYDAVSAGAQIGATLTRTNIAVSSGVFNVPLDFGGTAFNGEDRYLAISVRCPAGSGAYTALTPRQPITPVPYAMAVLGMRIEPGLSYNVIGGGPNNSLTTGVVGATIAGGGIGVSDGAHQWGGNIVSDSHGSIGGGIFNRAGNGNSSSGDAGNATVGGGYSNQALARNSTVSGGYGNRAAEPYSVVSGGQGNLASSDFAVIAGGGSNQVEGNYSAILGGWDNYVTGTYATVGGGRENAASADYATIGGGGNTDPSSSLTANRVTDNYGTVSGGGNNQAGDAAGTGTDREFATVGGGGNNTASGARSTVGGGLNNIASNLSSTIAGGQDNRAAGGYDAIGGGWGNETNNGMGTIGGGFYNEVNGQYGTVAGGYINQANGTWSFVGGGSNNVALGERSTVPGGYDNDANGDYSFAAGNRSNVDAAHDYSFVWSGTSDFAGTQSFGANTFTARAPGGVRFYSASTGTTSGVELAAGAGAWSSLSDRNAKANFDTVDTRAVLESLVNLPVTTWNYLAQDEAIRHIGVMAQDFYAAFNVGEDDRHITTIDADGVLFAAVQGLNAKLEDENAALRQQNADLEARVARLEALANGGESASLLPLVLLVLGGAVGAWVVRRRA